MRTSSLLPPLFHEAVSSYRARLYRLTFCGWMVRAAVAFVVPFILSMALDRFWDFPVGFRVGLLVLTFTVSLLSIVWLILQPIWDRGEESLAGMIDRDCPDLRDGLRSSMNLVSKDSHEFMLSRSIENVQSSLSIGRVRGLISWGKTPAWLGALILLAGFIGSLTFSPVVQLDLLVKRFFDPWGNYPRPSYTRILVDVPDTLSLTQGDDYQLRVTLEGSVEPGMGCFLHRSAGAPRQPNQAAAERQHHGKKAAAERQHHGKKAAAERQHHGKKAAAERQHKYQTLPMSPRPKQKFVFRIKGLDRPFDYFITAGDGRTKIRSVAMIRRPRIRRVRVQYKYPRYTRLPLSEKELKVKEIKAIEGTRVRLFLKTDLPIKDSWVVVRKKRKKIRWDRERTSGDFAFRLEESGALSIHLTADNGTNNKFDTPYNLKAIQDNPPAVSYIDVPRQLTVFRDDLIRFSYRGYDDFGIEEVFVRFKHQGDRKNNYLSLEFPKAGVKQFKGESVIEVNELIDRGIYGPPADAFDISLVMTDGKDQEGATQKLSFQVITDSPDRQLADLIRWQKEYDKRLEATVKTLRSQSTQLKILVEGMDENTEFTTKHQQRLDGFLRAFGRVGVRSPFTFSDRQGSVYRYGFYPRREGRASEELFTLPLNLLTAADYKREAAKSKEVKKRQKALIKLKELVDTQRDEADSFRSMLLATVRENQLQLLSYLAETWVHETGRMQQPENALSLEAIQEKQRERLESINSLITELGEFETASANEPAREAVQAAKTENLDAAKTAFEKLLAALRQGTELDGHFQKALWAWHRETPSASRIKLAAENKARLARSMLMNIILRSDNPHVDEAQFLQECIAYHALIADDAARDTLLKQSAALEVWQQKFDLFARCWLLIRDIEDFRSELSIGQLKPNDAVYRKKQIQIRESFLALLRDVSTDMFADAGPILGQVRELAQYRQPFMSWNKTPDALLSGHPGLMSHLNEIKKRLMPEVLAGLQKTKPLLLSALQTVSKNMLAEIPVIEHEMKELLKEVTEAGGDRLDLLSDTERKRMLKAREFGRQSPKRERIEFTDQLIRRLTGHAVTVAQVIDFIEKMWALDPQPADTQWVYAAENVSEVLRTFVERTYDKTGQIYGSNRYVVKGYPGILKEVHKNLAVAIPDLRALARDVAYLSQGNAKAVIEQPDFDRRLAVIHKTKSYREILQWLDSHTSFLREQLPRTDPGDIDASLASYANHSLDKVPFWRALYARLRQLSLPELYLLNGKAGWLDSFEGNVKSVHIIIRGLQPVPEELKLLMEALDDFPSLLKDLRASANITADESLQADLQDWQGLLLAVMSNIEDKLDREPLKFRPRRRYGTSPRFDLHVAMKLIVRDEARWLQRVKEELEHTISNRFHIMLTKAGGKTPTDAREEAAWQFSHLLARRHRSMSAQSIHSAGLPFDLGEGEGRKPKMPEYLYKELKRAMNRNYPQQFKEMGLKYLKELSEDSF